MTRLIASSNGEAAHTRPTTPVPSDYLFLSLQSGDDAYAGVLAGRLRGLAEEPADTGANEDGPAWQLEEVTQTRLKTVIPDGSSSPPGPSSGGVFSLLASVTLVPYLRCAPRDIRRGTIDHGQACILALVDGRTTVAQILDTSPMPVPRVLRILTQLLESGVVGLAG